MKNEVSRPFDVHRWSDYHEVNNFVNSIYDEHFRWQNPNLIKKHLKVVLLDLYVAWNEHRDMKLGIKMNNNAYKSKSRYNELHISKKIIEVIKKLHQLNLIHLISGFYDPNGLLSKVTRIWATKKLIQKFYSSNFMPFHINYHIDREIIILRDHNKKEIEYEDSASTIQMRDNLKEYNYLLSKTFIDIPELEKPYITLSHKHILISENDYFTRRIFNNSWEKGGRFYGGWWQRVPSYFRSKIHLNDEGTIEDDYKSLHPVLLYAQRGLNYAKLRKGDAYDVHYQFLDDKDDQRKLIKRIMLVAINAEDEVSTFRAVKNELQDELPNFSFTFNILKEILNSLKRKHFEISDDFCTGKGIKLMNLDGQIAEYIINKFTQNNIPILCIHDSFIAPKSKDNFLRHTMNEAIEKVISQTFPEINRKGLGIHEVSTFKNLDRDFYLEKINHLTHSRPKRTQGYLYRKQLFEEYLSIEKKG